MLSTQRVNVLLVVVLLGLTISLLIPVFLRMRSQMAWTESTDKLKVVLVAIHNFAGQNKDRLPPAFDVYGPLSRPASVHVHLLPHLEQNSVYRTFQDEAQGNANTIVPEFLARSDDTLGDGRGVQNFAANLRVFSMKGSRTRGFEDMPPLAPIEPRGIYKIQNIPDGMANTLFFATKRAVCGAGGSHYAANPTSPYAAFFGQNLASARAELSNPESTFQLVPCGDECITSPLMAQSFRPRTILVGFGDGAVRNIKYDVKPEYWNALLTPWD